jgi:hypothetical protein
MAEFDAMVDLSPADLALSDLALSDRALAFDLAEVVPLADLAPFEPKE